MSVAVVVGAGGTGAATATLLAEAGHEVRLVTRRGTGPAHPGITRVAADASDAGRLTELSAGARTLINCAAPPYHRWAAEFPPLAAAVLKAAEAVGADYVLLDNLYGYGQVEQPMTEETPLAPTSRKGAVRARLWNDALAAHRAGRVRVTTVRAGDFVGAGAVSVFTLTVAPKVLAGKPVLAPAALDLPHSWTGTRDAARALVAVSRDDRAWGRVWHAPTNRALSVRELVNRFAAVARVPEPKLRAMPMWLLKAAGLTSPMIRELPEMQYQFRRPFILDSSHTERTFDLEPTPLDDLLRENAGG
ncbi:NAD-dependent epimerase/dehydratase family protein [Amycolatopsis sp. SID8362]|uniref:NAD-dependent epimerase/dehydratase family protein n=1 Tax=Amycolatopsis sp. SID8362 TaxID=2690346 RepID=UPI00136CC4F0|nr:NAD-dependent epimerase/dehydratase family protein [Amycolatopsis sp. SID8362]NBH04399.1 NAD-dependent epimerase/dehydratase family protein [Amycolatopsis sp. SID8362]NED41098.1 NAD-dependent epimerase/dehydratase family protein [Amycolatopsis sp. SID8362]